MLAYAACASGAIVTAPAARVEVALAALALTALAGLLFGPGLRAGTTAVGWTGIALLFGFVVWTGLSLAWSVQGDGTWTQLNRAIAYLLALVVALIVGASLPAARRRVALGYLVVATLVALYALGGKGIPWFHIPGVIDLNTTAFFSRLRAPLAYWNALALFCAMAVPIALQAAIEPWRPRWQQPAAVTSLVVLFTTVGLTYSRGGVAVVVIAVALLAMLGHDRLRLAATAVAGLAGCAAPLALGFTLNGLTGDQVALHIRSRDGAFFTVALLAGVGLAVLVARLLDRRVLALPEVDLQRFSLGRRRLATALAAAVLVAAFAAAELGGSISQGFESFKSVRFERQNDPARILQTNSGNRWVWWNEALGAWSDRPLEGWGAGSFPLLHKRFRHNGLEVLQPHSVPLEWLAELGVVGALLGLGALLALAFAGTRTLRRAPPGVSAGPDERYGAALAAASAAWLVHMWFDWDWDIPGVAIPLMVFLGLLAARPRGLPGRTLAARGSGGAGARAAALALAAVLACGIAISAALPSLAAGRLEDAQSALADNDFTAALHHADVATSLDPLGVDALLLEARVAGRVQQFPVAAAALRQAVSRQPDNPDVWFGVARFDVARQDIPGLLVAVNRMLELDPVGRFPILFYFAADLGVRSATATGTPLPP